MNPSTDDDDLGSPTTASFAPATKQFSPSSAASAPEKTTSSHSAIRKTELIAGRYQLLEPIGEGGMGSVWKAEQRHPVKRLVAVKLIKLGMAFGEMSKRFESERQALALMDHPNIAKVLDGGVTEQGQPFFVMELVHGPPLIDYCDRRRLSIRERLNIFASICAAVQHAHQKGIIHRDLKPGNILVAEHDGKPVPQVIDFGLAKAMGEKLTDESPFTQFGAVVGTLEYMAPEQSGVGGIDVDTRADIYSLGVILYELITGQRPIDGGRLKTLAMAEIIRIIQEEEISKPSTRLSENAALPTVAASRDIEPKKLSPLLRGELDWMVMKCLEKNRDRRYETANALTRDIQRYLNNEPVEARPPSTRYRLGKFLRRYRGSVIAAGMVVAALIAGVVGTALGLVEARRQTRMAIQETQAKSQALREEARQRQAAEQANQQAFTALKSFTDDLMGKLLGSKDKLTQTEKSILRNAQKQWEAFAQSQGDSAQARAIRAEGAAELAIVQYSLGMRAEGEANDRLALKLRTQLATEFPEVPLYRWKQGLSHQNLGASLRGNGRRAEAETHFADAVAVFEKLAADFPAEASYRRHCGDSLISLGNAKRSRGSWADAERHYRDALAIYVNAADDPNRSASNSLLNREANARWGLASVLKRVDRFAESETEYRKSLALKDQAVVQFPDAPSQRREAANLRQELAILLRDRGQDEAAAKLLPLAIDVLNQLAAEFPSMPGYRFDQAQCRRNFGQVLGHLRKPMESAEQFHQAIAIGEALIANADESTILPYQADLGLSYSYFANSLCEANAHDESLPWYAKALAILTKTHLADPEVALTRNALTHCHEDRARALNSLGRYAEALPDWDKTLALCLTEDRGLYQTQRADSRLRAGQIAEAIAEIDELVKMKNPDPAHWFNLARLYAIASAQSPTKRGEFADQAVELLRKAAAREAFPLASIIAQSPDFAPLRDRDDFQKLLADLAKTRPAPAKSRP